MKPTDADRMAEETGVKDLEQVVSEIEEVMRRHDVVGVVTVADHNRSCYGIYIPDDRPVQLLGDKGVRINPMSARDVPFVVALIRLADGAQFIIDSFFKLCRTVADRLPPAEQARAQAELAPRPAEERPS